MKRFSLLFFLLLSFSLFADEEKDLRALHQRAESALMHDDYRAAKEAYAKILSRVALPPTRKYAVDWNTYVDLVLRLAKTCEKLGDVDEGESLIAKLLRKNPPDELRLSAGIAKAHFRCAQSDPASAYLEMKKLSTKLPVEKWRGEDRSFFHSVEYLLDIHYDSLMSKGKRFFRGGSYGEAAKMYKEVLAAIEGDYFPKISNSPLKPFFEKKVRYHLAEAAYAQADYEHTLELINTSEAPQDDIDREMLYLAALAHREKRSYQKALAYFQAYLESAEGLDLLHHDHALFELGLNAYKNEDFESAKRFFEPLVSHQGRPALVATLYLSRICLREENPEKARPLLASVSSQIKPHEPLRFELAYLQGETAFQMENYREAIDFYEKALPPQKREWSRDVLFQLGWSYLKLDDPQYAKACAAFERILGWGMDEETVLALARAYHLKGDEENMKSLVEESFDQFSLNGKVALLLLRAEFAATYEEREFFYREATSQFYSDATLYDACWYYRGLNHFHGGNYSAAIASFERAIAHAEPEKTQEILKLIIQANYHADAPYEALALIEELEENEESLYLRGLVASRIDDPAYFSISENAFLTLLESENYQGVATHALATLYLKHQAYAPAKTYFVALAKKFNNPEGWYWAAEIAEKMDEDPTPYRKALFTEHPYSPLAQDAYFRTFSLEAYARGEREAIQHLETFVDTFPHSPLLVIAQTLLGSHHKQEQRLYAAKKAFHHALQAFSAYGSEEERSLVEARDRALLELARIQIDEGATQDAHDVLLPLVARLERLSDLSYSRVYQESELALAECYLAMDRKYEAQELLSRMLARYSQAGISEGHTLAKVWLEQAKLAIQCEDFRTALDCLDVADEVGEKTLSGEDKLSLLILKSRCFREQKEYDSAMRMLSLAINESIASPLRVKAMLLRAEIYELQGRFELANRQLEATAKKGGEWAQLAREKLKNRYGVE